MKPNNYYDSDCDITLIIWPVTRSTTFMFAKGEGVSIDATKVERIDGTQVYVDGAAEVSQIAEFMSRTNAVLRNDFGMVPSTAKTVREWAGISKESGLGGSRSGAGRPRQDGS